MKCLGKNGDKSQHLTLVQSANAMHNCTQKQCFSDQLIQLVDQEIASFIDGSLPRFLRVDKCDRSAIKKVSFSR